MTLFEYSLAHWSAFFTAALLLNLSPGPDLAFILAQTAHKGRKAGFAAMFGIWLGAFAHVLLAALGLSALLATSALAFSVVKWMGAAYLFWLGIQALRNGAASYTAAQTAAPSQHLAQVFRQGVFVAALNPKVAIFFLAFLPQFVEPQAGPAAAQLFLHGLLIIAVAALVEPPMVLLGARLRDALGQRPRLGLWLERALGGLFITLSVKLALSER